MLKTGLKKNHRTTWKLGTLCGHFLDWTIIINMLLPTRTLKISRVILFRMIKFSASKFLIIYKFVDIISCTTIERTKRSSLIKCVESKLWRKCRRKYKMESKLCKKRHSIFTPTIKMVKNLRYHKRHKHVWK